MGGRLEQEQGECAVQRGEAELPDAEQEGVVPPREPVGEQDVAGVAQRPAEAEQVPAVEAGAALEAEQPDAAERQRRRSALSRGTRTTVVLVKKPALEAVVVSIPCSRKANTPNSSSPSAAA